VGVGALVGLVVAGGGARLAMGLIALADDREDVGSLTGSGALVGEITLAGTVAVLATGIALGIVGAFGYVAALLALSLVVGALAVKHAFEYADGSRLPG